MTIDARLFRSVMGHYPTGVCIVTALGGAGEPIGMMVGSFTAVSLDPPLVGFLPAKSSTSWPRIAPAETFCISVLSEDQQHLCNAFSGPSADRFVGVDHVPSPAGLPRIVGALAWMDCDRHQVVDTGDHWFVMGRVRTLAADSPAGPLVFHRGGFARLMLDAAAQ